MTSLATALAACLALDPGPPDLRPTLGTDLISKSPIRGDVPTPLIFAKPLDRREVDRIEAAKQLAAGCSLEFRRKLPSAYEAFQAAWKLDPGNLGVLKRLVSVGSQMKRTADVLRYGREALALEPDNLELLRIYTNECIGQNDVRSAVEVMRRALETPDLKRRNPRLWLIGNRLALDLSMQLLDFAPAAAHGRHVLAGLEDPGSLGLDPKWVRENTGDRTAVFDMTAQALRRTGRLKEAVELFERALAEPRGEHLRTQLAEGLAELGEHARALGELDKARETNRSDPRHGPLLVTLLRKLGREKEILATLNRWRAADRFNAGLSRTYARQLIEAKDYEAARKVLIDTKAGPETTALLVRLFREMKDPDRLLDSLVTGRRSLIQNGGTGESGESLAVQLKAITSDPEMVRTLAAVARRKANVGDAQTRLLRAMSVAHLAMSVNDEALAIEMFDLAVAVNGGAELYEEQGLLRFLLRREKYPELIRICDRVLAEDAGDLDAIEMKALALSGAGRHDEADKEIERGLAKANNVSVRIMLRLTRATVLHNRRKLEEAVAECRDVIRQYPEANEVPWVRYRLSYLLSEKGDFDRAEEELLKLIEAGRGPGGNSQERVWAAANNDLGYQWVDRGVNIERATLMIRQALEVDPNNGSYLDSLGWALFKQKKYDEAATYLRKAIVADDNEEDPVPVDHLGDVLLQLGKPAEAIAEWEKAMKFFRSSKTRDPDGAKAKQIERKIYLHRQAGEGK